MKNKSKEFKKLKFSNNLYIAESMFAISMIIES